MDNYQKKFRERWREQRKKSYNWKKVVIMGLALAALLILLNRLNNLPQPLRKQGVEFTQPDSLHQLTPAAKDSTNQQPAGIK